MTFPHLVAVARCCSWLRQIWLRLGPTQTGESAAAALNAPLSLQPRAPDDAASAARGDAASAPPSGKAPVAHLAALLPEVRAATRSLTPRALALCMRRSPEADREEGWPVCSASASGRPSFADRAGLDRPGSRAGPARAGPGWTGPTGPDGQTKAQARGRSAAW